MVPGEICDILNILSEDYNQGAYPGRNSEGLNPEWPCDPFHVLIATILSQRTKDDNTRKASDNLFHRYDSIEEIAEADPEEVAQLVRPAGFPRQKGKAIVDCCRMLRDVYGCKVPEDTDFAAGTGFLCTFPNNVSLNLNKAVGTSRRVCVGQFLLPYVLSAA